MLFKEVRPFFVLFVAFRSGAILREKDGEKRAKSRRSASEKSDDFFFFQVMRAILLLLVIFWGHTIVAISVLKMYSSSTCSGSPMFAVRQPSNDGQCHPFSCAPYSYSGVYYQLFCVNAAVYSLGVELYPGCTMTPTVWFTFPVDGRCVFNQYMNNQAGAYVKFSNCNGTSVTQTMYGARDANCSNAPVSTTTYEFGACMTGIDSFYFSGTCTVNTAVSTTTTTTATTRPASAAIILASSISAFLCLIILV